MAGNGVVSGNIPASGEVGIVERGDRLALLGGLGLMR
jgi:hypothetical protein